QPDRIGYVDIERDNHGKVTEACRRELVNARSQLRRSMSPARQPQNTITRQSRFGKPWNKLPKAMKLSSDLGVNLSIVVNLITAATVISTVMSPVMKNVCKFNSAKLHFPPSTIR